MKRWADDDERDDGETVEPEVNCSGGTPSGRRKRNRPRRKTGGWWGMNRVAALVVVLTVLVFAGCAMSPKLTPEMQKISSVSDTSNCKFIKHVYIETQASNMIDYVQLNTGNAGRDSYKIISTADEMVMGMNIRKVNFEVYKCR
jgi:hypothetical protein